jgi:hypothetical protein
VQYVAGWILPGQTDEGYGTVAPPPLPQDIEDVVVAVVKDRYFARKRDPLLKSQNIPDVRAAEWWVGGVGDGALPSNLTAMLDPYRSPVIA